MAKVELKQPIVEAISEELKGAQSVVLVDYRGLTVAQDTELRKKLREAGVTYRVYKNTMMKRAFEGTEFEGLEGCLEGPSAIAISKEDATAPARILCEFAKGADKLELKGGVVEGTVYDWQHFQNWLRFHPEKYCFPDYLEVCSHQLQTSLALSNRSQKKKAKQLQRQLKLLQRKQLRQQQSNWNYILYPAGYAFMG